MKNKLIKVINLLIIGICGLLVISLIGNISRTRQMKLTLAEAKNSLEEIKNKQNELQQDLSIVESDFYMEKEARNKLGLVKENEVVLVLPNEDVLKKLSPRKDFADEYEKPRPNWQKWMELFVGSQTL